MHLHNQLCSFSSHSCSLTCQLESLSFPDIFVLSFKSFFVSFDSNIPLAKAAKTASGPEVTHLQQLEHHKGAHQSNNQVLPLHDTALLRSGNKHLWNWLQNCEQTVVDDTLPWC
jgi:hypothetical protein